jgi:hypothetical protein
MTNVISPERRHSLIVPREHGAWGILLVPLVTGALAGLLTGGTAWPLAPLTVAVLALFWLRTPVENWMGTVPTKARTGEEVALVRMSVVLLAGVATAALIVLFRGGQNLGLLRIGAMAATAFLAQGAIRQVWRKARMAPQMVGAAGLTAVAPAAYYVVTGHLNGAAWSLWALNLLFAANQIQFVQLRIHAANAKLRAEKLSRGAPFLIAQALLMAVLAAGGWTHFWKWPVAAAFLPALWRGYAWFFAPFRPLAVHRLGKSELRHAIGFGVLLIGALALR